MEMRAELTEVAEKGVERAQDEAVALGHGYIGTEHLVIAFSAGEDSRAAQNIQAQGVGPEVLREHVRRIFDENEWNRYVPDEQSLAAVGVDLATVRAQAEAEFGEGAVPMKGDAPRPTRRLWAIFSEATTRARRSRGERASIDDVLAVLLEDEDSVGFKVLGRAGIDIEALRAALRSP